MSAPLGNTPRIQAIRDGVLAGRDMGIFAELITVVDAVGQGLLGLQQAVGSISQRVSALEAVGHLQQQTEVPAAAVVEAEGLIDAVTIDVLSALDLLAAGDVGIPESGQVFGANVSADGVVTQ